MTLGQIDIKAAVANAEKLLKNDQQITPPVRAVMSVLLLVVKLLMVKTGLNSRNSSIPPSQDQNRKREKKSAGKRKAGGQPGRSGTTLKPIEEPDEIQLISKRR